MAKYMVTWDVPPEVRDEAISRFMDGSSMEAPEGVSVLGRWFAATGGCGWSVVETDDPKMISAFLLRWSDLLSYDATPVISDEELGENIQNLGLG